MTEVEALAAELMHRVDDAIIPGFVSQIPEVIATLSGTVQDVTRSGRRWVFYGSVPLGADHKDSDLDALLLHDQPDLQPHRRTAAWNRRPVTVYVLSWNDLVDDGRRRRFGGYYALKLLSPFVADQRDVEDTLAGLPAGFLGPWSHMVAAQQSDAAHWSSDQLLAHAYLAFLDLYPDFAGYFARLLRDPVLLAQVWRHQRRVHIAALAREGFITAAEQSRWRYTGIASIADSHRERSRCTARFWAFGSVCHGDAQFPDFYFTKTDAHASHREQWTARELLCGVADGGGGP